ncbi:MAG: hypothetical protein A4E34_00012 [Methanoregula sp. PtaU1.Bin006]|uniref:DUF1616 domain-containing protein n=1 Tax=Methanoregula sp. PtaU1.Bin006 TaxID=1811681 RepID=UPI0009D1F7DA|nr:DUF1616 domain-containing protein [Methanoregula sp. PtaU1.Bin006]OPY37219.1 MAG: hypothetical protein A4E34_00012 [Methanoregula sp. PtaU1.Bin006]
MDAPEIAFGLLRLIFGFLLVLFIPGYVLSLVIFPFKKDLESSRRLALSLVLSIASVLLLVLFSDIFLGIDSTPQNIVTIILVFSAVSVIIWKIEIFMYQRYSKQEPGIKYT